jgi:hypothetical protein
MMDGHCKNKNMYIYYPCFVKKGPVPYLIYSGLSPFYKIRMIYSIPCMALQPLPGLGLPQSAPPLVPVFSSSPPKDDI